MVTPRPAAVETPEPEGAASAANLRSRAAPVRATPQPPTLLPLDFATAPQPADGADASSGAADSAGPGTGAGGAGDGFGSGAGGSGTGGGVPAQRAAYRSGGIKRSEYPAGASRAKPKRVVGMNLDIDATGRVTRCAIAESSGDAVLDRETCRLAVARFRYRPARNADGKPVPDRRGFWQAWALDGSAPTLPPGVTG